MKIIFGSLSHKENLTNNKENIEDFLCFGHHKKNHPCVVILTNENNFNFFSCVVQQYYDFSRKHKLGTHQPHNKIIYKVAKTQGSHLELGQNSGHNQKARVNKKKEKIYRVKLENAPISMSPQVLPYVFLLLSHAP